MLWSTAGVASATPTSDFTFSTDAPAVGESVAFTFTGTCDVAPCRIQWRWFKDGGRIGTTMGEGTEISYAFDASGSYSVTARITNGTSTHGSAIATHVVKVHATYQEDDRAISYDGWRGVVDATASDGGYRVGTTGKPRASIAFTGTRVRYIARTGPNMGIAEMRVDGVTYGSLDLYAKTPGTRSMLVSDLADGPHRGLVRALGAKNALSTGTAVSLDRFGVGTLRFEDNDPNVAYNGWVTALKAHADGGRVRTTGAALASTQLTFSGTTVSWVTATGPAQGKVRISIDGNTPTTVDNYAGTTTWRATKTFVGLALGVQHTIKVVVLGTRNPSSTSNRIVSDGFIVQ
jgi:hypothetical protein